ncbi:hypothetical protein [Caballeronia sp. LZ034LL]|uniref:hypothetical protein n=1 Tax=Caballeronia sp. LZ034LL TaxID=3038567 RepID=UPI00285F6D0E|nr:hypothetical protein [Caballeronia sp. LZ034LL]MDR5839349.1 hypothetical protein [Caballeronia sp. LZ034LL]
MSRKILWSGRGTVGYECSSIGDKRFSALFAKMPDGRTIEQWYQCDIKGYDIGGTNWRAGKGNAPHFPYPHDHLWQMYLGLWRIWALHHEQDLLDLAELAQANSWTLKDTYANTQINQAHALATILNEWVFQ